MTSKYKRFLMNSSIGLLLLLSFQNCGLVSPGGSHSESTLNGRVVFSEDFEGKSQLNSDSNLSSYGELKILHAGCDTCFTISKGKGMDGSSGIELKNAQISGLATDFPNPGLQIDPNKRYRVSVDVRFISGSAVIFSAHTENGNIETMPISKFTQITTTDSQWHSYEINIEPYPKAAGLKYILAFDINPYQDAQLQVDNIVVEEL